MSIGTNLTVSGISSLSQPVSCGDTLTVTGRIATSSYLSVTGATYLESTLRVNGNFYPKTTNTFSVGTSSLTFKDAFLQNAPTIVSDINYKTDVLELSEDEIYCAVACAKLYRRYKLKSSVIEKEDGARYHIGTIAQYVVDCFTSFGLDWTKYGVITYDKWESSDAVTDEEGNIITPAKEAGEIYMVRYDEFNSFVNAGQQARIDKLESLLIPTT